MEISPDMGSHYCYYYSCKFAALNVLRSLRGTPADASLALLDPRPGRRIAVRIPCLGLDIAPLLHDDVAGERSVVSPSRLGPGRSFRKSWDTGPFCHQPRKHLVSMLPKRIFNFLIFS